MALPGRPTITNLTLTNANTEYSVDLPNNTFKIMLKSRTDSTVKVAFESGESGTNLKIGDQVNFSISRIASVGDAYAGEALVGTLGFHYQADTMGSRTISAK